MNETNLLAYIVPLGAALLSYLAGKHEVSGRNKDTKEENKDKIYNGWEKLYNTQLAENLALREEIKADRLANSDQLKAVDKKMTDLEAEFQSFRTEAAKREEGFKLTIELLEDEKDVLLGENEEQAIIIVELKTENYELKQEVDNLIRLQVDQPGTQITETTKGD